MTTAALGARYDQWTVLAVSAIYLMGVQLLDLIWDPYLHAVIFGAILALVIFFLWRPRKVTLAAPAARRIIYGCAAMSLVIALGCIATRYQARVLTGTLIAAVLFLAERDLLGATGRLPRSTVRAVLSAL